MDFVLDLDKSLFVFFNSLGSEYFDSFWLFISESDIIEVIYLFLVIEFLRFFCLHFQIDPRLTDDLPNSFF